MFTRQHHNAIAKDIRTELTGLIELYEDAKERDEDIYIIYQAQIKGIADLALRFTTRFELERLDHDGYEFDALKFMDACSPNKKKYPLSELWLAKVSR